MVESRETRGEPSSIDLPAMPKRVDLANVREEASRCVLGWNERRRLEGAIGAIGRLKADRATLTTLLGNVIDQLAHALESPSLLLAKVGPAPQDYTPWLASGGWREPRLAEAMLGSFKGRSFPEKPVEVDGIPVRGYRAGELAAFWVQPSQTSSRHARLIPGLLEVASLALDGVESASADRSEETFAAISQAIGTIVHDLRSPIGAIQSALDVAMMSTNEPADLWEMLEIIGRSADDAMAIVGDIVDFTRNSAIDLQPFEIEELFDIVREKTHDVIVENSLRLSTKGAAGLWARGDRRKLERALINLVNASAKFLSRGAANAMDVRLTASPHEGDLQIAVAVDGPEIPAKARANLFAPFATPGKEQAGRLAVAIAKQIIESHGGAIELTSAGGWTTFLLTIPGPVGSQPPPSRRVRI
ncbi:sensor histidine kinase [Singulisphaera sp. PoT]|uniref:sensor histidine kinase n=1 Tax=Singulisphaera sp. PoT TaxID=3411797 RepID=UPI003BF5C980